MTSRGWRAGSRIWPSRGCIWHGSGLCFPTFVQDTPRQVRYRVEFCKEADRDGPPQDLKDLYRDFGWDYVGRAWDSTLLIFRTRDSRAEELHTDPPLQGELLEKLARRLGRRFFGQLVLTLVLAVLCAVLMGPAPVAQLVTHPQLPGVSAVPDTVPAGPALPLPQLAEDHPPGPPAERGRPPGPPGPLSPPQTGNLWRSFPPLWFC